MKIETLEFQPSIFSVWFTPSRPVGGSVEDEDVLSGQSREEEEKSGWKGKEINLIRQHNYSSTY